VKQNGGRAQMISEVILPFISVQSNSGAEEGSCQSMVYRSGITLSIFKL